MKVYYVVHKGRVPGIYSSWDTCKKHVTNFDGAIFKKFTNEAEAKNFLENGFGLNKKPKIVTRRENEDKKNAEKIDDELYNDTDGVDRIFIYTDGSCIRLKNNLAKGGYGINIPSKNIQISKPLLNQKITNNRAEMTAIIESIDYLDALELATKRICILTDSQYSMYIFHGTGERYEKDNYMNNGKAVPNIDLIKKLLEIKRTYNVNLLKVRAHTNKQDTHSLNNEIADNLATAGANQVATPDNNPFLTPYDDEDEIDNSAMEEPTPKKAPKNIFGIEEEMDLQMNELFGFDELQTSEVKPKEKKITKNTKLSQWFIKN